MYCCNCGEHIPNQDAPLYVASISGVHQEVYVCTNCTDDDRTGVPMSERVKTYEPLAIGLTFLKAVSDQSATDGMRRYETGFATSWDVIRRRMPHVAQQFDQA